MNDDDEDDEECVTSAEPIEQPPTRVLEGHAVYIWNQYLTQLRAEYKDGVDLLLLEDYAYLCGQIRVKQAALEKAGTTVEGKNGELRAHPLVSTLYKWNTDKRKLESQLGVGTRTQREMAKLGAKAGGGKDNPITARFDKKS